MAREAFVVLLVLIAPLAGCLERGGGDEAAPAEDAASGDSALARELGAVPARENVTLLRADENATEGAAAAEPWWLATAQILPEGGLAAFWWTVPEGAIVRNDLFEAGDGERTTVVLEAAPILAPGAEVTAWGLLGFIENDDGLLEAGPGFLEVTAEVTVSEGHEVPEYATPQVRPAFVSLGSELEAGDRIGFLLMAVGETGGELGVAFRVMAHDPMFVESEEDPVADAAAFLSARGDEPPMQPATTAGTGFLMDAYMELAAFLGGPFAMTMRVGDVGMEDVGGPLSPARSLRLWTTADSASGWGIAGGGMFAFGAGATHWTAGVVSRDVEASGEGVGADAAPAFFLPGGPFLYASGGAFAIGEGDGDVTTSFAMKRVGVPLFFQAADVAGIAIGATLEDLFGVAGAERSLVEPALPGQTLLDPERAEVTRVDARGATLTWRPIGWPGVDLG